MNDAGQPVDSPRTLLRSRWVLAALIALPGLALAGDMDAVGDVILALYIYIGVVVVGGVGALVACRWIGDPRWRLVARWLIVVMLYTPVPRDGSVLPAFLAAWGNHSGSHAGLLGHPMLLAYACAVLLSGPVVALWIYVSRRYAGGRDLASQPQRTSVTSSPATHAPPT